ncbi:hypothetical protein F53441_6740 [Fusarium austroafricanum]|uniref:ABC transporter n=1 Tax=Fusarium austroafricanum TaxID=2364996 RepID=A0A8H4KH75_9HYPO|nr:hypothetical protein F53441_6740 [Fusarium austroafricanum]
MSSTCLNDGSWGPGVQGCRGDFDFTQKFERIFLSIIPAVIFIAATIARVAVLSQRERIVGGIVLQSAKIAFLVAYAVTQLAVLILIATGTPGIVHGLSLTGSSLGLVASTLAVVLSFEEHSCARRPSTLLNVYIFFTLLFDVVQTRTAWLIIATSQQTIQARLFTASVVVKAVILCLETIPKTRWIHWNADEHSPEESSSVFSIGAFLWLNTLFMRGYQGVLAIDGLYPLDETMASSKLYRRLAKRLRVHRYNQEPKSGLLKDLTRTLIGPFLLPIVPRVALIAFKFCQPFFIDSTLAYLQMPETPTTRNMGYGLIGASFLIYAGIGVSSAFYGYYQEKAVYMIRGCLVAAIYQKTTQLKITAADDSAALTLMSADVERILNGASRFHELWANTIEVAVGCYLLHGKIGIAFLSPVVVIIVCAFLLSWLVTLVGKRQSEWMARIQNRVGLTANAISQMKLYKISGIAGPVADLIQTLRVGEIKVGNSFRWLLITAAVLGFLPICVSPVVTFAFTSKDLTVNTLFTSLSYILLFTVPVVGLFQSIPGVFAALTCTARVQKFLASDPRSDTRSHHPVSEKSLSPNDSPLPENGLAFLVENGKFGWGGEKLTLNHIDAYIPAHKLTIVVGEVASGKSTFCKALLGEVPVSSGTIKTFIPSRIGYCEQTPFLYNATFQENIVGHCAFDQTKYDEIVEATMLSPDVALLPQGHDTKIGSNGIMLSGGQKQRLSVARALYSEADLMIFDDILSGLDLDTESELFRRVFGSEGITRRRNATVVICTHSIRHLPLADHIIALGNGTVIEQGIFSELMENNKYVYSLGVKHRDTDSSSDDEKPQTRAVSAAVRPTVSPETMQAAEDKARQQGDWSIYKHYFKSVGFWPVAIVAVSGMLTGVCNSLSSVWVKFWAEDAFSRSFAFYIGIFGLLRCSYIIFLFIDGVTTLIGMTASAGTEMHQRAILTVISAPLSFFTKTDTGIVTNLFSQDMTLLDSELPLALTNFSLDVSNAFGTAFVVASASPYLAIGYPFLMGILYFVQKFYLRTSRQIRLLDLEAKSPLYTHFTDTIKGVATIRAFGWEQYDIAQSNRLLDRSQRPAYLLAMIQQWLGTLLHFIVTGTAVLLVALATQLRTNAGLTGASLVSLLTFSEALSHLITSYTSLETSLGAVSRLRSFTETVETENMPGEVIEPPETWPHTGNIQVSKVSASYDSSADEVASNLALRDLELNILPGQKVAICGRTGSGKSTLILLLLRLIDPLPSCASNMKIDGIYLHQIDRATLRKRIICIPQDAVFLPDGSSVKANIDPYNAATDAECFSVLNTVRLSGFVQDKGSLSADMSADDLSAGQKQLFSLGRAILRRRVRDRLAGSEKRGGLLLLDEVSSSVDKVTDRAMQEIIRKEFESYTIVMVSHRLEMVMDFFDRVVVLDKGTVVESGRPRELVETPGSRFGDLWAIES